jgi:hypothetical protein
VTAVAAIAARDRDALMASFSSLEEAEAFRTEVLPELPPADCKWFWQQVMEPEQLERTIDAVRDVCLSVARDVGLELNKDFTAAVDVHGDPILIAKPEIQQLFYAALPLARHSVLRFYLQSPLV